MNTIGNYIKASATLYQESADKKNELTEMDFLSSLAARSICGLDSTYKTMECYGQVSQNKDGTINNAFGEKGTVQRLCHENKAKRLYQLAMRYIDSTDEYSYDHPYLVKSREIKAEYCR